MRTINLKAHILVPLVLVLAALLIAFVLGVYYEERDFREEDIARTVRAVEGHYSAALEARAQKLSTALEIIAADPSLREALEAGDRETLLRRTMPVFERLSADHQVTHFYFHDPQRVNLLRVHQPDRHGDTVERITALDAERQRKLSYGAELGPLGTFTLRAVRPLHTGDRLLGYVELGEEIDTLVQEVGRLFGVDLVLVIDKKFVTRESWESGMEMLGRDADWNTLNQGVVVSQTFAGQLDNLRAAASRLHLGESLPSGGLDFQVGDMRYLGGAFRLQDAAERTVGAMLVLRDMAALGQSTLTTITMIGASALVLGAALILLFYLILERTERQLKGLLANLRKSRLRLTNAQRMARIGNWEWNIQRNVLHFSHEASRILGLEEQRGARRYADLLECIHPDERRAFIGFIEQVSADDVAEEWVSRILKPDGGERVVRHCAELMRDASGNALAISATIQDVTELQQAETRSACMSHILENSWNEIYAFDADTLRFVEVSHGACRNLGYTLEEMHGLTPVDLKPSYTLQQFNTLIDPLRQGDQQQIWFETEHRRKDGSRYPVEVRLQLYRTGTARVFIAIIQDISERRRYIEELEHKALHDTLTDLPNRSLLLDRLDQALRVAHREAASVAVLMVDVLRLREINDLLGHQNGDRVLMELAARLQAGLRGSDTVARLGGDEFVVVLANVDVAHLERAAGKVQQLFEQPIVLEDTPFELEAAIGIAHYPEHGDTPAILIQHADIAMRLAKSEATGFRVYDPHDDPFSVRKLKLHGELRQAIANRTLAVHYQPKVDIRTGRMTGVEALARWPHPREGMISPADFIPMVEQSGLIRPFTLWVMEQAIEQVRYWHEAGMGITVAINLSTRNLLDPGLADSVADLLQAHEVNPRYLTLEVTESAVMSRPEQALTVLTRLHAMGLRLSIDDFGTGYSSLSYLKRLPVSELKIDSSFVSAITRSESDAVIVRSTVELAHNLGLQVVAEGVESREILERLSALHCETAQGFYFSRPLPPEQLSREFADRMRVHGVVQAQEAIDAAGDEDVVDERG